MIATTQEILDWARQYIPDLKLRNNSVRDLELGLIVAATGNRETFYLKNSPTGSVFLYVEPYTFSATSSLSTAATGSKVFQWAPSTLSCIFPDGETDVATKPFKFKPVLAYYEYEKKMPYSYSDTELINFLSEAISYLNNSFSLSYTYTGTISSFDTSIADDNDKELVSKALAVIVRRNFADEQKQHGLGVAFRGPMHSIDTKTQLNDYRDVTKRMEEELRTKVSEDRIAGVGAGQIIDNYTETVVDT
jgi:hypothetical protein